MLRSSDGVYSYPISRIEVINHGTPFLVITSENVTLDRASLNALKLYKKWEITGMGNQFKTKIHPIIKNNVHAPNGIGTALLTYDLITELYFPIGKYEINFGPIPPSPLPMPQLPEIREEPDDVEIIPETVVMTLDDRNFNNLDLEDME